MHTYIKHIQSKPEHIRKQILVVSLVLAMFLVALVWLFDFTDNVLTQADQRPTDTTGQISPFQLLSNSFTNTYHNLTASVGNISFSTPEEKSVTKKQIDLIVVDPNKQK